MIAKLKVLWGQLPPKAQGAIVGITGAILTATVHAFLYGNCYSLDCFEHYLATGVTSGVVAARAFFMIPSNVQTPQQPPQGM